MQYFALYGAGSTYELDLTLLAFFCILFKMTSSSIYHINQDSKQTDVISRGDEKVLQSTENNHYRATIVVHDVMNLNPEQTVRQTCRQNQSIAKFQFI